MLSITEAVKQLKLLRCKKRYTNNEILEYHTCLNIIEEELCNGNSRRYTTKLNNMKKQSFDISRFLCPDCGNIIPLPRQTKRKREAGHIKDIYCPWCDKIQKTIEYRSNQPIKNGLGEYI